MDIHRTYLQRVHVVLVKFLLEFPCIRKVFDDEFGAFFDARAGEAHVWLCCMHSPEIIHTALPFHFFLIQFRFVQVCVVIESDVIFRACAR